MSVSDPGQQQPHPWPAPGPGHGPAPHYPPLAPPPWAPPPRRRRSRWLTVGLPIGGVLLLGGCGAFVVVAVRGISGQIGPAQEAAGAYAGALVEQRWDDAHDMLCDDSAARLSADDLAVLFGDPALTGFSVDGVNVVSSNGRTTGDATLTFQLEGGLEQQSLVPLVEDGGDWRPCP